MAVRHAGGNSPSRIRVRSLSGVADRPPLDLCAAQGRTGRSTRLWPKRLTSNRSLVGQRSRLANPSQSDSTGWERRSDASWRQGHKRDLALRRRQAIPGRSATRRSAPFASSSRGRAPLRPPTRLFRPGRLPRKPRPASRPERRPASPCSRRRAERGRSKTALTRILPARHLTPLRSTFATASRSSVSCPSTRWPDHVVAHRPCGTLRIRMAERSARAGRPGGPATSLARSRENVSMRSEPRSQASAARSRVQ